MFEKMLKSAFDSGADVFVYMNGFNNPLRGRVQDMEDEFFTLFQSGKFGTVLWAFRLTDVLSCGLLVGPPLGESPAALVQSQSQSPSIADASDLDDDAHFGEADD